MAASARFVSCVRGGCSAPRALAATWSGLGRISAPTSPVAYHGRLALQPIRRMLSTGGDKKPGQDPLDTATTFWAKMPQFGAAAGVIIAMYGVSKVVFWMSSEFMSINFATVGYIGFSLGILTTGIVGGGSLLVRRLLTLPPQTVVDGVFAAVKGNPEVTALLGEKITMSALRSSVSLPGGLSKPVSGFVPEWRSPIVKVVFPVSGSKGAGMVCGEATVARGKMQLRAVTFDATGKVGTPGGAASLQGPLLVTGSRHRIGVRDEMKALVDESYKVYSAVGK